MKYAAKIEQWFADCKAELPFENWSRSCHNTMRSQTTDIEKLSLGCTARTRLAVRSLTALGDDSIFSNYGS